MYILFSGTPSNAIDDSSSIRSLFAAAQELDVLLNVERSVSGASIIRLTSYE